MPALCASYSWRFVHPRFAVVAVHVMVDGFFFTGMPFQQEEKDGKRGNEVNDHSQKTGFHINGVWEWNEKSMPVPGMP